MHQPEKPKKIVIIDTYNPRKPAHHPAADEDSYYLASWGGTWAKNLKARYPYLDIEMWRPEPDFNAISNRNAYGVNCTIFPARCFVASRTVTLKMLKMLFAYNRKFELVVHKNSIFDWQFNILMPLLLKDAKIVLSHHGGVFPLGSGLLNRLKLKLLEFSYKNIDAVTYLRSAAREVIEHSNDKIKFAFLPVGANFDHFIPLDKKECRKKLKLPLDKVLAVYVGRFYRLKSVDRILEVYHHHKSNKFEVLFVGGNKSDELYTEVSQSGASFWGHVDHDLLREIYSAADFYIHPVFHPEFGGFDVSLIEAMACNRPILSPQLKELDFDYSQLGLSIDAEKDILSKSEIMIDSFGKFTKCREAAINHLDRNTAIIDKLYRIYTEK
ncbi:MAG: glycosyltransferase family 4 protein [Desulfobacterales bacterium]|nr:glycosyltransferase family 4 protein [Desulfobacterales bacterium]